MPFLLAGVTDRAGIANDLYKQVFRPRSFQYNRTPPNKTPSKSCITIKSALFISIEQLH